MLKTPNTNSASLLVIVKKKKKKPFQLLHPEFKSYLSHYFMWSNTPSLSLNNICSKGDETRWFIRSLPLYNSGILCLRSESLSLKNQMIIQHNGFFIFTGHRALWKFTLNWLGKFKKMRRCVSVKNSPKAQVLGLNCMSYWGSKLITFTDLVSCVGWRGKIYNYQKRL